MTDRDDPPSPDDPARRDAAADTAPAAMDVRPARDRWWQNLSPVWLVPLVALAVAVGLAWNSYASRGTLITISFQNASGIEAGQTPIKFRDVTIGVVDRVNFSGGLTEVLVEARVDADVAAFMDEDAEFWVVRPEVSVRGVTGLDTVLSGAFIAGRWNSEAGDQRTRFTGLETAPIVSTPGTEGMPITLRLKDGNQITSGAPILFKGIEVGSLGAPRLSEDGTLVLIDGVVQQPYAQQLTSSTRFWDASGFDVSIGTSGVQLDVKSLASLIEGGISFDTVVSGGQPVEPGMVFDVFPDESSARDSIFNAPNDAGIPFSAVFAEGSVSGLEAGAEVRFRGLKVGEVTGISAFVTGEDAATEVWLRANFDLLPTRLGLPEGADEDATLDFLAEMIEENGLRARLASASILTGALIVELVELPEAAAAELNREGEPYPLIPTVPAEISDFAATSQGVFERINALPVEELMQSAIDTMDSIRALAADPDTRRVPGAAADLLEDTRALVTSEDVAAIPGELRSLSESLNGVMAQIEQAQTIERLIAAVDRADAALAQIETAAEDFPAITDQVRGIAETVNGLPMEQFLASLDALVDSADALIGTEEARSLPPALADALHEVTAALAELRNGGAIANVNSTLSAAEEAARAINEAAQSLPDLSERLSGLVVSAGGVVATYGDQSRFNTELLTTLRDVQAASESIEALARAIERNPQSLLLGR
ncbi:MlaD family protein [Frigidibacter oleivorans]|uniref:MlaD family protein n=1 Tax=Frigidibacter oleivorans TaxID=2487129 RepID=UPI001F31A9DC|nr:MlaD family protein [Frigidibacter oleivorans]